jgi:hypothetical protein
VDLYVELRIRTGDRTKRGKSVFKRILRRHNRNASRKNERVRAARKRSYTEYFPCMYRMQK